MDRGVLMGSDEEAAEHADDRPPTRRPGGPPHSRQVTLDSREFAGLLLEMGRAATAGELGVYDRDELDRARESGYAQGWQDAMRYIMEQGAAEPHSTSLAEVIALIDTPLPSPRASDLRSQEPLMPHRKRKPGDQRSG
ncbi:hypothetical protein [Streptomyces sp. NPDC048650]|uniref:hypothetical protein n=1 Tax=unclassified Streptomyces TaxID=2593676 RepID=UPI0037145954